MRNNLILKIIIIFITIVMLGIFSNFVYADNFDLKGFDNETASNDIMSPIEKIVGTILGVMRTACVGIAIIIIMVLSIKYMSSAPGERAEIKKSAIQYGVGALIFFGAAGIIKILESATNTALPTS